MRLKESDRSRSSSARAAHRTVVLSWGLACALAAGAAIAQEYPSRVVRILTAEVGGGADFVARVIAQGLTEALRQQVIIENRTAVLSIEIASRATADGHTLLLYGSALWLMPYMRRSVAWDPIRDFAPITVPASSPNIVAVHQTLAARSVKELIALMFPNAAAATPHVRSGRLRALAVTSPQPSPLAPGIPTVAASGLPGYESVSFHALMAPAKTPRAIIQKLHETVARYVQSEAIGKRLLSAGVEPVGNTPEDLARTIKTEMLRLGKVIAAAGIRAE